MSKISKKKKIIARGQFTSKLGDKKHTSPAAKNKVYVTIKRMSSYKM